MQRFCVVWLKQHKTIHFLHLFRQYSALSVVISSAFLVTGTNLAANGKSGSLLSGYFHTDETPFRESPVLESGKRESLSLVPLAMASSTVDPEAKLEDPVPASSDSLMIASQLTPAITKDPEEDGGVTIYTVESGDTVSSIAKKYKITVNTIYWANDFDNPDQIKPGDQIFILPVAGIKHIVKKDETIEAIAKELHGDKDRIIAFNDLPANGRLEEGQEIIIPDGYKEIPHSNDSSLFDRKEYATASGGSSSDISGWRTPEGKAGTGHKFPYGYCTWYVAQHRYVPWGGNAGTWLYSAKSLGYKTGKKPKVGSIMVTTENRYYGHVALVEKVSGDTITVSEMNYVGWGKVNRRTLSASSRAIKGFIY